MKFIKTIIDLFGKGDLEFKTNGKKVLKIKGNINLDSIKTLYVDNEIELIDIEKNKCCKLHRTLCTE